MAEGGIQKTLTELGVEVRVQQAALTPDEEKEYGGWKRLGMALGHYAVMGLQMLEECRHHGVEHLVFASSSFLIASRGVPKRRTL